METSGMEATSTNGRSAQSDGAMTRTTSAAAMLLPAAMAYCGKRLLDALERTGKLPPGRDRSSDAAAEAALTALSESTRELLAWWFGADACRRRPHNFHAGQREAILHTILAHELFASDDPQALFEAACRVWPNDEHAVSSTNARTAYRLRMPSSAGGRWVLQALIVWQWAGRAAADADRSTARRFEHAFGARLSLLAPDHDAALRYAHALFGVRDRGEAEPPSLGSMLRHADVFLPPRLRHDFAAWSKRCNDRHSGRMTIELLDDHIGGHRAMTRLIVDYRSYSPNSTGIPKPLWIELEHPQAGATEPALMLAELSVARALRIGAVKSVLLVDAGTRSGFAAWRSKASTKPRRHGLRPVLPRRERPLLDAGLRTLDTFERDTRVLREHLSIEQPPALLVLCELPERRHAAAAYARQCGVARDSIFVCDANNADAQSRARVVIDTLPARHALAQSRFCAVVLLREPGSNDERNADLVDALGTVLGPALAPHWHAPSLIETKAENRERIAAGRAPETLIDVLPVIAAAWPAPASAPSRDGHVLLRIAADALPSPAGDLFANEIRENRHDADIVLPSLANASSSQSLRWLSDQRSGLLRARDACPVRKCVYKHLSWSPNGDGLERALIEMAEADPNIRAYTLFHALRQPWPNPDDPRSMQDPQDVSPPVCPNALALTATYVYVVRFASHSPVIVATPEAAAPEHASCETSKNRDALIDWCRDVNALPAERRQDREWRSVRLQAPLFWSWKRHGRSLSSLLSALAEAPPISLQRLTDECATD